MILTPKQVRAQFENVRHVVLPDSSYWVPDSVDEMKAFLDQVYDVYYGILSGKYLSEQYQGYDLLTWFKHHDCNRKAMALRVAADAVYALYYAKAKKAESPPVFYVHYMKGRGLWAKGTGHAIDVMIGPNGLQFIEPQSIVGFVASPELSLNKHEFKSIWLIGG